MNTQILAAAAGAALASTTLTAIAADDAALVAKLDTEYQAAVERNDWQTMDRILHKDFVLVLGDGRTFNRSQLIDSARNPKIEYEKQVEMPGTQTVRMYGNDTATVTALLLLKGKRDGEKTSFERKLWFTDTYVRTVDGWKYAFGQASLSLPAEAGK